MQAFTCPRVYVFYGSKVPAVSTELKICALEAAVPAVQYDPDEFDQLAKPLEKESVGRSEEEGVYVYYSYYFFQLIIDRILSNTLV